MSQDHQAPLSWDSSFPNQLAALMRAIDDLENFLTTHNANPKVLYTARLAAEEMGTNILKYGYDDSNEHVIRMEAKSQPDAFIIRLIDDGHFFDPTARPDPSSDLTLEDRAPGGWGISLVRRMARSVTYQRLENQNVLTITLDRSAPAA